MVTTSRIPEIPTRFWAQIDHQLDRIERECPDSFAAVREILLDPAYNEVQEDIHRNFERKFPESAAFFAGSGGERQLRGSLRAAGWIVTTSLAWYYWDAEHPVTKSTLTYIEGDVLRGTLRDHG